MIADKEKINWEYYQSALTIQEMDSINNSVIYQAQNK